MLLAALKLQVVALVTVAGVNTDTIDNANIKGILETLDKDAKAAQAPNADPAKGSEALKKAVEAIAKMADEKDADKDALYIMGLWTRNGLLTGASGQQVLDFYQKAADKGQVLAKVELAQILLQTFQQDAAKAEQARKLLEDAEKAGNNTARFLIANFILNGQAGYTPDVPKAQALLEAGRAAGDGACTFGLYQLVGRGVKVAEKGGEKEVIKQDSKGAVALLEEAAVKQSYAPAMTELAQRLFAGDDTIKKDVTRAVKMYTDASEKGNPFASRQLGIMNEQGSVEGVTKDAKKALEFFQKAAAGNDPVSLLWIGNALQTGYPADAKDAKDVLVGQNAALALNYYRQAAAGGLAEALFNVGVYYESGTLVDKDPVKAFALFHRAALGNLPAAMFKVAGYYQQGGGSVAQDPIAARGWYQRAAQAGLPQALLVMGAISQSEGQGTNAIAYFEAAATAGLPQAMASLAGLYNSGGGSGEGLVKANKKLAYVWASLASEAVKDDKSVKDAVDKIFGELSAAEKEEAKKLLDSKRKDLEAKRSGAAAPAASSTPASPAASGSSKGSGKGGNN